MCYLKIRGAVEFYPGVRRTRYPSMQSNVFLSSSVPPTPESFLPYLVCTSIIDLSMSCPLHLFAASASLSLLPTIYPRQINHHPRLRSARYNTTRLHYTLHTILRRTGSDCVRTTNRDRSISPGDALPTHRHRLSGRSSSSSRTSWSVFRRHQPLYLPFCRDWICFSRDCICFSSPCASAVLVVREADGRVCPARFFA